MTRKRDGPTVTDALVLGPESVGVMALPNPHSALVELPTRLHDYLHDAVEHVVPWQPAPRRRWQQPTSVRVPCRTRPDAPPLVPIIAQPRRQAGYDPFPADEAVVPTALLSPARSDRSAWQHLHRLVDLSGLGWAFVLAAVGWELFALEFCRCAGWGLDKGAFFLAWGLGILVFGCCLRPGWKRPAVSRLFLGMNILVMSVLSLVVATR